jgi:hypothetical protein
MEDVGIFVAVRYILWTFATYSFHVLVSCTEKNLATLGRGGGYAHTLLHFLDGGHDVVPGVLLIPFPLEPLKEREKTEMPFFTKTQTWVSSSLQRHSNKYLTLINRNAHRPNICNFGELANVNIDFKNFKLLYEMFDSKATTLSYVGTIRPLGPTLLVFFQADLKLLF